jgi:hypothetical protein
VPKSRAWAALPAVMLPEAHSHANNRAHNNAPATVVAVQRKQGYLRRRRARQRTHRRSALPCAGAGRRCAAAAPAAVKVLSLPIGVCAAGPLLFLGAACAACCGAPQRAKARTRPHINTHTTAHDRETKADDTHTSRARRLAGLNVVVASVACVALSEANRQEGAY